jgi:hypothetical protein
MKGIQGQCRDGRLLSDEGSTGRYPSDGVVKRQCNLSLIYFPKGEGAAVVVGELRDRKNTGRHFPAHNHETALFPPKISQLRCAAQRGDESHFSPSMFPHGAPSLPETINV